MCGKIDVLNVVMNGMRKMDCFGFFLIRVAKTYEWYEIVQ